MTVRWWQYVTKIKVCWTLSAKRFAHFLLIASLVIKFVLSCSSYMLKLSTDSALYAAKTDLGAIAKLRKGTTVFAMSVRPSAWNNSAPTGLIFIKFYIWVFFETVQKIQVSLNLTKLRGILHEYLCTFVTIYRWILLRIRNVSTKNFRGNQNTFYVH